MVRRPIALMDKPPRLYPLMDSPNWMGMIPVRWLDIKKERELTNCWKRMIHFFIVLSALISCPHDGEWVVQPNAVRIFTKENQMIHSCCDSLRVAYWPSGALGVSPSGFPLELDRWKRKKIMIWLQIWWLACRREFGAIYFEEDSDCSLIHLLPWQVIYSAFFILICIIVVFT